jgi:uncharacterized RDD family membrane protein YckC
MGQNAGMAVGNYPKDGNNRPGAALAGRVVGAMVGPLVNPVIEQVDVDEVVSRIDLDQVLRRVDLDEVLDRIDVEALIDRIDPDRLLSRVDLNRLLEQVDLNGLVQRIDIDPVLDRVDLNEVLGRVDLDALIGRLDVNAVVQRLDVNAVVDRLDVNRVLERVDTDALVSRTEFGSLIAKSTTNVFAKVLDVLRSWVITLDVVVHGVVDRLFRQHRPPIAAQPEGAADQPGREPPSRSRARLARALAFQGVPAGMVSRFFAFLLDVLTVDILFSAGQALFAIIFQVVAGHTWQVKDHQIASGVFLAVLVFVYFTVPIAVAGRTFGQMILGLKVRGMDRPEVGGWDAALRTITFPLSILLLGVGILMGLLRSDRRMLQDVIASTEEIYDWDARGARLRALAERPVSGGTPSPGSLQAAGTSSRAASP